MDKLIDRLLRQLKYEMWIGALVVLVAFVLGETGVIPNGIVEPKSREEFVLTIVVVALTLVGIPLAMKLFALNTTKGLRRMNMDEALQSYHHWSIARLAILVLTAVCGVVVYYITMDMSPVYCVLLALAFGCYCYPSRSKLEKFIEEKE